MSNKALKFYRNSEYRWITIVVDPVHIGKRKDNCNDLERRTMPPLRELFCNVMPAIAEKDELKQFAKPNVIRMFRVSARRERGLENLEGLVAR